MTSTAWRARLAPVVRAGPRITGRALGVAALWGLVLCALSIVLAASAGRSHLVPASVRGPLPSWLSGPFAGAGGIMSLPVFSGFLVAMLACYLVAVACAPALEAAWVLACAAVLIGLFAAGPPLLSKDIFSYIAYARLADLYHLNPYVFGPVAAAGDPTYRFVGHLWKAVPTVYGPAFTLPSYLVAPLGVGGALWALKAAAGASAAGMVGLVWWSA